MSTKTDKISMQKKYRTRDGQEVRLYAVDVETTDVDKVHGVVLAGSDWSLQSWTEDGFYIEDETDGYDLIEVKQKIQKWVNVYDFGEWSPHELREEADNHAAYGRKACILIEYEEGEGLE